MPGQTLCGFASSDNGGGATNLRLGLIKKSEGRMDLNHPNWLKLINIKCGSYQWPIYHGNWAEGATGKLRFNIQEVCHQLDVLCCYLAKLPVQVLIRSPWASAGTPGSLHTPETSNQRELATCKVCRIVDSVMNCLICPACASPMARLREWPCHFASLSCMQEGRFHSRK